MCIYNVFLPFRQYPIGHAVCWPLLTPSVSTQTRFHHFHSLATCPLSDESRGGGRK